MISILRLTQVLTVVFSLASFASADIVTVQLTNGQSLTVEVHPRVDAAHLWLRYGGGSTIVLRPLAWKDIESARYNGNPISIADLQGEVGGARPSEKRTVPPSKPRAMSDADWARVLLGFGSWESESP